MVAGIRAHGSGARLRRAVIDGRSPLYGGLFGKLYPAASPGHPRSRIHCWML